VYKRQVRYCLDEYFQVRLQQLSSEREKWSVKARDQLSNLFISVYILRKKNPSETSKCVLKSVRLEVIRAQNSAPNSALAYTRIEVSLQVTGKSPYLKAKVHGVRHIKGKK